MNRNEIITDIGERLTDAIYELNDSFEWDYCEESGSRSHSCTACIKYEYGGKEYDVQVWACWPHVGDSSLEVEISGGKGKAGRWKYYRQPGTSRRGVSERKPLDERLALQPAGAAARLHRRRVGKPWLPRCAGLLLVEIWLKTSPAPPKEGSRAPALLTSSRRGRPPCLPEQ